MKTNQLYVTVMPIIHLGEEFGRTEQVLTLFPSREFASEFFPDEVAGYVATLQNRFQYLVGGHVTKYEIVQEKTSDGRIILRVVQHVS